MRWPVDTPERMKDWPFFDQTGNNSMALLLCLGGVFFIFGIFGCFYYADRDDEASKVEFDISTKLVLIGVACIAFAIIGWTYFGWTAEDYS